MSFDLSPRATPSPSMQRPLPPSRSRRRSMLPNSSSLQSMDESSVASSPRSVGVMGGLRERTEEELKRASREAIEEALREEWEVRDRLVTRSQVLEENQTKLEKCKVELEAQLASSSSREEETMHSLERLDNDLAERDEVLDRLRLRLAEVERTAREAQKKAVDQERAFETERQALQTQEAHLQQRIRALMTAKNTTSPSSRTDDSDAELREELASLNVSNSTLLAQLNTVSKDVAELRAANEALQEENEGWEYLVRERTFSGRSNGIDALGLLGKDRAPLPENSPQRAHLQALDEELEMDELHSELEAQSPILVDQGFARDLDANSPVMGQGMTLSPSGHLAPPKRRSKGESLGDLPVTGSGLDLAAELGRAEADLDGSQMRVLGKGDEGEALRAEVKNLREANKALTLYCSKIIDRIIAQEGFEQILAVDYKTRRMGKSTASRPSLRDITETMQENQDGGGIDTQESVAKKKARPLSFMARTTSTEKNPSSNEKDSKEEKKSRRGFSIDFRSLGFSLPLTSPDETKPNTSLKPLALSGRASLSSTTSKSSTSPPAGQAKKLEPQEEDEDDKRERHHLEATLRLMGIERSSNVDTEPYAPSSSYWTGKKLSKAKPQARPSMSRRSSGGFGPGPQDPQNGDRRDSSPLSRLSSHLSSEASFSPLSPREGQIPPSPMSMARRLEEYDQQEAERAKALAQGKAVTAFTTPAPGSGRPRSRGNSTSPVKAGERSVSVGSGGRKVTSSESSNTLWSIGSSSRPGSGEVVPTKE